MAPRMPGYDRRRGPEFRPYGDAGCALDSGLGHTSPSMPWYSAVGGTINRLLLPPPIGPWFGPIPTPEDDIDTLYGYRDGSEHSSPSDSPRNSLAWVPEPDESLYREPLRALVLPASTEHVTQTAREPSQWTPAPWVVSSWTPPAPWTNPAPEQPPLHKLQNRSPRSQSLTRPAILAAGQRSLSRLDGLERRVSFSPEEVNLRGVTPYGEVYGMHPKLFNFDADGNKVRAQVGSGASPMYLRDWFMSTS